MLNETFSVIFKHRELYVWKLPLKKIEQEGANRNFSWKLQFIYYTINICLGYTMHNTNLFDDDVSRGMSTSISSFSVYKDDRCVVVNWKAERELPPAAAFFVRSSLWRFPRGFHSILFFTQKIKGDERRAGRCRVQKLQIAMKKQAAFFFIHNEPKELEMLESAFCPQKEPQSHSVQSKLREPPGNTWWTQWSKLPHHTWNQVQRRRPSKRQHVNHCIFQSQLLLHNKSVETEKINT